MALASGIGANKLACEERDPWQATAVKTTTEDSLNGGRIRHRFPCKLPKPRDGKPTGRSGGLTKGCDLYSRLDRHRFLTEYETTFADRV
jgi:hypothetical protein